MDARAGSAGPPRRARDLPSACAAAGGNEGVRRGSCPRGRSESAGMGRWGAAGGRLSSLGELQRPLADLPSRRGEEGLPGLLPSSPLEGPGVSPPPAPSSPPADAAASPEGSSSCSASASFPVSRSSQTKSAPARPPPTSRADQTAPMAESSRLRETTATETSAQVAQAEPHLPRPLQPFTVRAAGAPARSRALGD